MIRLAKDINLAKKSSINLEKKTSTDYSFRKPPKRKSRNSPNPLDYEIVDPQEGLVPLFNSPFYATPDTPADPMDCDRYPDSPWCGENPIDLRPVGLDVAIVLDECNFGVQFSGTLGFIKLPPLQIVYRNPECKPLEPPRPPDPVADNSSKMPANCPYGLQSFITLRRYSHEYGLLGDGTPYFVQETYTQEIKKIRFPSDVRYRMASTLFVDESFADFYVDIFATQRVTLNSGDAKRRGFLNEANIKSWLDMGGTISGNPYDFSTVWEYYNEGTIRQYENTSTRQNSERVTLSQLLPTFLNAGIRSPRYISKKDYEALPAPESLDRHILSPDGKNIDDEIEVYKLLYICGNYDPPLIDPPPPPKEECCKMGCCPDNSNLERLLRLILKKIGSDDLPASVPKLLTKKDAGIIQIQNLAQYISYTVKQLDALAGKYPLEIKIKDADLTQEGNQEKKISLPNIAEALSEIMGILLMLQSESNANLIATTNSMIEAGSAKQSAILAYDYSKANAEYLGYKGKQVEKEVPFTFKPGEPKLDKMLVSGKVKIKGWENDDKEDLNDALAPLLELAAMWKAANFKNLGTGDPLSKLKEALLGAVNLSGETDKLVKDNSPTDANTNEPKKNEWDSFLEEAEQGFIAQPGITDTTNPYSRPLAQRPKIREIGNDTSDVTDEGQ